MITQMRVGAIFFLLSCVFFLPVLTAEDIKDFSHTQRAWIDLNTGESHGIKLRFSDRMRKAEIGGKHCVGTRIGDEEQFIYFDIDDAFIYDGNHPVVDVTIEYYDQGTDALNIHFDCKANFYSDNMYAWRGKVIHKTDSKNWRRFTARLTDARFANRQKHHRLPLTKSADLRIHNKFDGSQEYISFLEVKIPYLYISTGEKGNIFKPGQTVSLDIKTVNRALEEKSLELAYEITGYDTGRLEQDTLKIKIPGDSILERKINVEPKERGIYFVNFALKENGNIIETARTNFAVCDEAKTDTGNRHNSPFGISVGYGDLLDADLVDLLIDAGVGWVRFEPVWRHLEKEKGKFNWGPYDRMVEIASERGLRLYGLLAYGTDWADPTTGSEEAISSFANYASKLTERYKDKIKFWEVWNEEDWMGFWRPEADPLTYRTLLKEVYVSIKKADPECKVIIGGLTGNYKARGRYKFLTSIYKYAGGSYFDIVAIHPYVAPLAPETNGKFFRQLEDAAYRMRQFDDDKKSIWITELGWPSGKGGTEEHVSNKANVSLEKQAQYLVRSYVAALSSGRVDKIFWHYFKNSGHDPDIAQQNFGLVNADLSPKPAYVAYRIMAGKFLGLTYSGKLDLQEPLRGYVFGNKSESVKVLWSVGVNKNVDLPVKGKTALLTDIMGETEEVQAKGGKVNLLLTESPIFLEEK